MKKALVVLCLSVALIALPACTPPKEFEANPAALQAFDSPITLAGYFAENSAGTPVPGPLDWLLGDRNAAGYIPTYYPGIVMPYDPTASFVGGMPGSDTGIQDLWADEMDTARLQGDYLYVLDDYGLSAIKAVPADQMEVVGRFTMLEPTPCSLQLLDGHKAVIVSYGTYAGYDWHVPEDEEWLPYGTDYFDVYLLDLQDPASPVLLAHYSIQGQSQACRVVGGNKLSLVVANYPGDPYYSDVPAGDMAIEDILPKYRLIDTDGNETVQSLLSYDQVLRPANPDGNALLTLVTIDLAGPAGTPAAAGFLGYWDVVYQTPASVYFTNTPYKPGSEYACRTTTEIHRFDITAAAPRYAGSIKLDGRTDPYGSFSEIDGQLRVVTAKIGNVTDILSYFNDYYYFSDYIYYALQPTDTGLQVASQSEYFVDPFSPSYYGIAGNYFVVGGTRSQDEELVSFVVDMSDAAAPQLLGQATWPIDWAAIYALDSTRMMAMGWQWTLPNDPNDYHATFQLRMYDIAQPLQPDLLHSLTVGEGYTDSTAAWNSQQIYLANGLLILPIDLYEGPLPDDSTGLRTFGGLYAYHLSAENGFELIGRVETADPYRSVSWHRPILKNGVLYAVTNAGVHAVAMDDMDTVLSSVRLPY